MRSCFTVQGMLCGRGPARWMAVLSHKRKKNLFLFLSVLHALLQWQQDTRVGILHAEK